MSYFELGMVSSVSIPPSIAFWLRPYLPELMSLLHGFSFEAIP